MVYRIIQNAHSCSNQQLPCFCRPVVTENLCILFVVLCENLIKSHKKSTYTIFLIGHGGFGHVALCQNKLDGRQYALKKIRLKDKNPLVNDKILRFYILPLFDLILVIIASLAIAFINILLL